MKYTPELILNILHSIKKVSISNGELDIWQDNDKNPSVKHSFTPGSFTYELMELIENHLTESDYSPFDRTNPHLVSKEDLEYLKGTPVPLKITMPIVIEKESEWVQAGFSNEKEYLEYLATKPKDEPFK